MDRPSFKLFGMPHTWMFPSSSSSSSAHFSFWESQINCWKERGKNSLEKHFRVSSLN
jgi:hypothetical protein